jgi:hypothetical protein
MLWKVVLWCFAAFWLASLLIGDTTSVGLTL